MKRLPTGGAFRFRDRLLYLANAMVDQHIGLEETEDGRGSSGSPPPSQAAFDERDYVISG